jgi:Carboxypeptidase regulatory-like domain/TonB dependent receptor-like, beta-barrel
MSTHQGRKLVTVTCCCLVSLLCATYAGAQAIHEGKLTGTVAGEDKAVIPGATVEISSSALQQGSRSTTTSETGTFLFLNLPPGRYTVTTSISGFKTVVRENIEISGDKTITLDLLLPVGEIKETVTVSAAGPIVDTKTSNIDTRFNSDMLTKLPTSRDAFYDVALTAPGMFEGSGAPSQTTEFQSPTAYGSATNENVFLINGVDATSPRAGSFGSLVNVNYDTVEEVRIVATGSKAEYASFSGAAIDVLTKSGSNTFHGTGAFYSKLGSLANNQPDPGEDFGTDFVFVGDDVLSGETKKDWEWSGTLGGPIVKDKLWFFGAFNYLRSAGLRPRWSLENESWSRYADAKVTASPSKNQRLWGQYHFENNDGNGWSWGSEPQWDTTMTYGVKTKNHTPSAQWQWFPNNKTSVSAKYLGFWTDDQPYVPSSAPDHPGYINWWKWAEYGINGAFPYVEAQKSSRQTFQADMSHFAEEFLGQHDINWQGGYFQNYVNFLYPYRWTQSVENMQNWYGDTGLLFYNNKETLNPFLTVRTADSRGAFFDDQWSINKRLTANVGLRFDRMTTKYGTGKIYDFVTSPEDINGPPSVLRDRASTGNIFDFKTWAPRLGLSYLLTEDGKTVARVAYGRYYQPISVETLRRFGPDMPILTRTTQIFRVSPWSSVDTNGDGTVDTLETSNAARRIHGLTPISQETETDDRSWTLNVADDLKNQYTDQITLNVEREVARNLAISGSYIYKRAGNLFTNIPINELTGQPWDYERIPFTTSSGQRVMLYSVVFRDYNGDGVLDGDDVSWVSNHNTSRVENLAEFDGVKPKRVYQGLQFVVNKRYSDRWQGLASLLYSNSEGFGRRSLRQDFNVEAPMFFDDNWMRNLNHTVNNLDGPLPYTPTFELKLSGSYRVPRAEVDLGVRYRMNTGRAAWLIEDYPLHTEFASPPGGVINPDGAPQIVGVDPNEPDYLPNQHILDLHIEKAFKFGSRADTVHLVIDGFNIFNSSTPLNIDVQFEYGRVTSIPTARRFRFGLRYEF